MPDEWKTSVIVPIRKGKGDVMSCGSYRKVKLLEHAMKIVERVLGRRIQMLVNLNKLSYNNIMFFNDCLAMIISIYFKDCHCCIFPSI